MPLITLTELENAYLDAEDLGQIVGGASNLNGNGTVTTRLGAVVKTLAKVVADGTTLFSNTLKPKVYANSAARAAALASQTLGQIAYDRETKKLYCAVDPDDTGPLPREWVDITDLTTTLAASIDELIARQSEGTMTVNDYVFMEEREKITDKDALTKHHIKWPGKDTFNDGLAAAFGFATWPTITFGQEGVDYGCRIPLIELTDFTLHPAYELATQRIKVINTTDPYISGYSFLGGYVDVTSTVTNSIIIEDCHIDCNYNKIAAVAQNNEGYPTYLRNCTIRRVLGECITLRKGHVINCSIEQSQADGIKADSFGGVIDNNMIRLLGQVDPGAHGDVIQVQNCDDLVITRNTFYMPGTGTTYDETSYGTTQCVRLVTENASYSIKNVEIAGNVMLGGGYSLSIWSRFVGCVMENIIVANNIFGDADYYVFGHMDNRHHSGQHLGVLRNLIIWGNKDINGNPIKYAGADQNGIWHYDKNYASERFLTVGKKLGLLDWNGDLAPGVTSRTS